MSEQPEEGEMLTPEALKAFMDMQMQAFEGMNAQISSMLDGFDQKIKDLSDKVDDLKKKKEAAGK